MSTIDRILKKLAVSKKSFSELTEEEQREMIEMLDYYRAGKRMFWVFIAMGMLATAGTAVIVFFKSLKG